MGDPAYNQGPAGPFIDGWSLVTSNQGTGYSYDLYLANWDKYGELVDAAKKAAKEKSAGLGDTDANFKEAGKADKEKLFASDKTHMGAPGHELICKTIMDAIEKAGK